MIARYADRERTTAMDAILDIARGMRLTGGVFLEAELTAPWCLASKMGPEDCAPFMAEPRHIIAYHFVAAGEFLLKIDEQKPVTIRRGEIVVLPRNDAHLMGTSMRLPAVSADDLIKPGVGGGLARIVHGGGGERTRIICGFLGSDLPHAAAVAMLPSVMKIDVTEGASGEWIESSLRFAAKELTDGRLGSPSILARLAELLFIEAVRRYFADQSRLDAAWTSGLQDPVVGRALGLLHGQLARRWTTDDLADAVGSSRSAFAERFTRLVGQPPMRYLALQRLARASSQLRDTPDPIARIAYDAGYESEASFNRAFRRAYGAPPGAWRKGGALEPEPGSVRAASGPSR